MESKFGGIYVDISDGEVNQLYSVTVSARNSQEAFDKIEERGTKGISIPESAVLVGVVPANGPHSGPGLFSRESSVIGFDFAE